MNKQAIGLKHQSAPVRANGVIMLLPTKEINDYFSLKLTTSVAVLF